MLTLSSSPTGHLSAADRLACVALAERISGRRGGEYLAKRFERYPTLFTAHSGNTLVAFMLTDSASADLVDLHYVGPVFSTQRAYLTLFAGWVDTLSRKGNPFAVTAEVESALVRRDMERLLPRWIYPGSDGRPIPSEVQVAARATELAFSHVRGLDLATLTTEAVELLDRSLSGSRYQLLVLPCFGRLFAPDDLRKDLAHGLAGRNAQCTRKSGSDLFFSGPGG